VSAHGPHARPGTHTGHTGVGEPPPGFAELLARYAPFRAPDLVPELEVPFGRSLIEIWEAAEIHAGHMLPSPFWAYPWAAGVALARVILDRPEFVRGQRVLDFGCGGGIASLAAARAGASRVTANDIDPWALATVRLSAAHNRLSVDTLLGDLTAEPERLDGFDVILCGDLAYEKDYAPAQRDFLSHASRLGKCVIVADAGRTYFTPRGMTQVAEFTIAVPRDLEGVTERTATVWIA